jgi:tetraacyldisaccharide 4'-kinase
MKKVLKYLLLPFSLLYWVAVSLRNFCYSVGIFKSHKIAIKSVCIGNLSAGGTGKTPMTLFLAEHFSKTRNIAILSRGYGRKSSGFLEINRESAAEIAGDESAMYAKRNLENTRVFVCEKRAYGVKKITTVYPSTELILLDDALQHRAVTAGFTLILTDYSAPFYFDLPLPAGRLRESKSGKNRAHAIVVTKCPTALSVANKQQIEQKINTPKIPIYFASIAYSTPVCIGKEFEFSSVKRVLLVTAIADARSLIAHFSGAFEVIHLSFPDHHPYTDNDLFKVHQKFDTFASDETAIVTTEKDLVKFADLSKEATMKNYPWFYQPITVSMDRKDEFLEQLNNYVDTI